MWQKCNRRGFFCQFFATFLKWLLSHFKYFFASCQFFVTFWRFFVRFSSHICFWKNYYLFAIWLRSFVRFLSHFCAFLSHFCHFLEIVGPTLIMSTHMCTCWIRHLVNGIEHADNGRIRANADAMWARLRRTAEKEVYFCFRVLVVDLSYFVCAVGSTDAANLAGEHSKSIPT